jgi:hypothetical protein
MRYLLIGNGPSALAFPVGASVDAFDGKVVRFNHYLTKGYEKFVGKRTDIWATVSGYPEGFSSQHEQRWWLQLSTQVEHEQVRMRLGCQHMPKGWRSHALAEGMHCPSSGASLAAHLLHEGHSIVLWGFDFMSPLRKHHYGDSAARGDDHDWFSEWCWFTSRLMSGSIDYLGWDRRTQGSPIVRLPTPCGSDVNVRAGREPTQMGWYEWAAERSTGGTVLDIGAGTCEGLRLYESKGIQADGLDVDVRLAGVHPRLRIEQDLSAIPDKSYDTVTAMDVVEHVVDDVQAMNQFFRIARKQVIITTPNGFRSQCLNIAHCREYTIPQFVQVFSPDEVWSGAPDGKSHITLLLKKNGDDYADHTGEGPENTIRASVPLRATIPLSYRFNNTVDREEWAHITGVFYPR